MLARSRSTRLFLSSIIPNKYLILNIIPKFRFNKKPLRSRGRSLGFRTIVLLWLFCGANPGVVSAMETDGEDRFFLHLASFRQQDTASDERTRIRQEYTTLLGDLEVQVRRVVLDERGVYYRILAGPFVSRFVASAYCTEIRESGQSCMVIRLSVNADAAADIP